VVPPLSKKVPQKDMVHRIPPTCPATSRNITLESQMLTLHVRVTNLLPQYRALRFLGWHVFLVTHPGSVSVYVYVCICIVRVYLCGVPVYVYIRVHLFAPLCIYFTCVCWGEGQICSTSSPLWALKVQLAVPALPVSKLTAPLSMCEKLPSTSITLLLAYVGPPSSLDSVAVLSSTFAYASCVL